jgi:pimeloyl-ACP methyl ester carboxylesterase
MRTTGSSSEAGQLYFTERGAGPPLLLVHGLMVSGTMFEPALDRFAAFHHVIVPNLRGHGRSRTLPPPYTARQLAADLAGLLQQLGIASAAALGDSQGGRSPSNWRSTGPSAAVALSSGAPACTTGRPHVSGSKAM